MDCEYIKQIGKGVYGEVWKAVCNGENVAVKIFTNPNYSENYEDWIDEVKILKKIMPVCKPYALCMLDKFVKDKKGYIVTDFIDGKTFLVLLKEIDLEERKSNFQPVNDLIQGINLIHQQGVVHQDIKGENIMFDTSFKYIDFGYSCHKSKYTECIRRGTEYTMPPDIVNDESPWEQLIAQDIWSVGTLLLRWYQLVWNDRKSMFIRYSKFSENSLVDLIKNIENFGVRAIVGLLLERDWKQRIINFEFVLKMLKNIDDISTKTEIDTIKIVDLLITKIHDDHSSIALNNLLPTVQRILNLH